MPSIKCSRYVRDGEVDPSIAANVGVLLGKKKRLPSGESAYLTELEAWLLASRGLGALLPQQWDLAASPLPDAFPSDPPRFFWSEEAFARALDAIQAEWPAARKAWASLGLPPEAIDAMLFFDGEHGEKLPSKFVEEKVPYDQALSFAMSIGSSVPPIGRSWLAATLMKDGFGIDEARKIATDAYAAGGDMLSFRASFDRRRAIAAIMMAADPRVSEAQIDRVVRSPMSVEQVRATFGGGGASSSSGIVIAFAAAAALAFFLLRR